MAEAQGREKNDLDWDETRGLERYARDVVTMTAAGSVCEDPRRVVAACGSLGVSGFGNRDVAGCCRGRVRSPQRVWGVSMLLTPESGVQC